MQPVSLMLNCPLDSDLGPRRACVIEAAQQVSAIFEPGPQEIENDWWPPGGKTVYCINKHDLGPSLLQQLQYPSHMVNVFGH